MIDPMGQGYVLAPSILAADFLALGEAVKECEAAGADWIHIDVMDGHFVPNLTMGPAIVEACRRATSLPLDVHLMVEEPGHLLGSFAAAGASSLTVHQEAVTHLHQTIEAIHQFGLRAGVALNPATPAATLTAVAPMLELVLMMTVHPGFGGQEFIPAVLGKVAQVRQWQSEGLTRARIQVDGGIDGETAPQAAEAGAEIFVAGVSIFQHPGGIARGVHAIRSALRALPVQE
jgi:ribulose-phosphate 3-epimerase